VPNSKVGELENSNVKFVLKVKSNMQTELVRVNVIETRQTGVVIKPIETGLLTSSDRVVAAGPHLISEGSVISEWKQERGL